MHFRHLTPIRRPAHHFGRLIVVDQLPFHIRRVGQRAPPARLLIGESATVDFERDQFSPRVMGRPDSALAIVSGRFAGSWPSSGLLGANSLFS